MKTEQEFISGAKRSPETEIAEEYHTALADAEHAGQSLSRYLRISKEGTPIYAAGVEYVAAEVDRASQRLDRVKIDIKEYLECVEGYDSAQAMVEKLLRLKRTNDNLNRDLVNITKQVVNKGAEPRDDPSVQAATDKRDRVLTETKEEIKDLTERISRIKEVTARY